MPLSLSAVVRQGVFAGRWAAHVRRRRHVLRQDPVDECEVLGELPDEPLPSMRVRSPVISCLGLVSPVTRVITR